MLSLKRGINIGGWLSQYRELTTEHLDSFITRSDIEQIAKWGFDHIRLPVDYPVLEDDNQPGVYSEAGFQRIEACINWCRDCGLKVVFDLHHAPGFSFNNALQQETIHLNTLFTHKDSQERFVSLWKAIASRLQTCADIVVFELLNEVVLPETDPWNKLAELTMQKIRVLSNESTLMVGSNRNNAPAELHALRKFVDRNLIYSFHFYEPLLFTHQKAPWIELTRNYQKTIAYDESFPGLEQFLAENPRLSEPVGHSTSAIMNRELVDRFFEPVRNFRNARPDAQLYCGEWGVIEYVAKQDKLAWVKDAKSIMENLQIGWAYWTYKAMDFGLVDLNGNLREPELLSLLVENE